MDVVLFGSLSLLAQIIGIGNIAGPAQKLLPCFINAG